MKGILTLKKSAALAAVCMAMLCLPGYSEPTPEQIKERTALLFKAVSSDNTEQVKMCIKLGADVNAKVYCWRAYGGWDYTTDKDKINNNHNIVTYPLITYAITSSYDENKNIVELLIKAGADVNAKGGENDDSLLRIVALKENNVIDINRKYIADLLIKAGADVNAKNKDGRTALRAAAMNGHKDIVELLIKAGADVNSKASDGKTALIGVTSENGNKDIAELLIKAGADVNAKDNDGYTALMHAVGKYFWENERGNEISSYKYIAELLIKAGADADATLKWTVIDTFYASAVKFLIELGTNVNATDNDGLTLLTHAILHGKKDIADLLRAAGAKE